MKANDRAKALREIERWKLSPRVTIEPGTVVRFSGGPEYLGDDGKPHRITLAGAFRVRRIFQRGRSASVFLEVAGMDHTAGTFTVFVSGRSYRRAGVLWKPYRVKRKAVK